jgi:hypothetical protein
MDGFGKLPRSVGAGLGRANQQSVLVVPALRKLTRLRCDCYSSQVLRVMFGVPVVVLVVKPEDR